MRKLLILLGASDYPNDADLRHAAFAPSHAAVREALLAPLSPVADEDWLDLFNSPLSWPEQQQHINAWIGQRRGQGAPPDGLLVHYVGHGGFGDGGGQFYLSINSTNPIDPYFSSIPGSSLDKVLNYVAGDLKKFLIIDACFAAALVHNLQGALETKIDANLQEVGEAANKRGDSGLAALFSSSSTDSSDAGGEGGLTQFADALVSVLRTGDPKGPALLSFEKTRELIGNQLRFSYGRMAVPPSSYFPDDIYEPIHRLPLFPNRAERPADILRERVDRPEPRPRGKKDVALQLAPGNPGEAGHDPDNFLVCHPQFAASFNTGKGRPNWVSWHLRYEDLGRSPRTDMWRVDPALPEEARRITPTLFRGSGYDRGHLCPPHQRSASEADNQAMFSSTNIVAQTGLRNRAQGLWIAYEQFLTALVREHQCELYVVTGPFGETGRIGGGLIAVPSALWSVALCVAAGDRIGPGLKAAEVIALRMSNSQQARIRHWTDSSLTVAALEDETPCRFFANLPGPLADRLKRRRLSPRLRALAGAPSDPEEQDQ